MNKKKYDTPPKKVRRAIIRQVQRFQELSKEVAFLPFVDCRLKNITSSKSLRSIREKTHLICHKWGKDYEDVETMLQVAESMRKSYVNLIFRTQFIRDPRIQSKLDEIPLALGEIIKENEEK